MSAFANTKGGALIFGIDDNDNVVGVEDAKAVGDKLSDYLNSHIEPHPITDLQYETIVADNRKYDIVVLYVYPGGQTPYYYTHKRSKRAFMRMPNSSVPADKPFLDKLVLKGSNMTYDRIENRYKETDLSFSYLKRKFKNREKCLLIRRKI